MRNLPMTTPQSDPSTNAPDNEPGGKMSFFEHLVDLRKRLIHSAAAIAIGAFVGVGISQKVIGFISRPMQAALRQHGLDDKLIYTSPAGLINIIITFGIYIGVVLAAPYVLYQVWLFIAPGLYKHERKAVTTFIFSSLLLFIAGLSFGYFIILPYMLNFLIGFQGPFRPLININEYFDFILIVLLGLGVIFELPVIIFFLALFNIVTPKFLWKNLRYAILIIAVVAAIVTPTPDATTMLIFMAPMIILYFAGIGVAAMVVRNKRKNREKNKDQDEKK
jgi:sec-independent protein translocase protein TatC